MWNKLGVATGNRDKVREIGDLLAPVCREIVSARGFPGFISPEETGVTLAENARIKAEAFHRLSGLPALADDTGLFVEALDGAPGVFSSRFAGPGATYQDNVHLLLEKLSGIPREQRGAEFRTVICLCTARGCRFFEGVCPGEILAAPRGPEGAFGYDPVFLPRGFARVFAEMPLWEKNRISHRGLALGKLVAWLAENPEE